ncbi:MAG: rod shape-determining protein MreD [Pseudomonadota bacterium]
MLLLLGVVFLGLQTTFLNFYPFMPVKPDLIIIIVAYLGIFKDPVRGIFLAAILGYLTDTLSGSTTGLFTFLRIVTFLLAKLACENIYIKSILSQIVLIIALSIIDGILLLSTLYVFSSVDNLWIFVIKFLPIQATINGIFGPLIFLVLKKTELIFHRQSL